MKTKTLPQLIGLIFAIVLLTGCSMPAEPTTTPAPASTSPAATEMGFITGTVHLYAPPTPGMVIYAVDPTTNVWGFAETQAADGAASFTIRVPPGAYQVFAAVASGTVTGLGYSLDERTLAFVTVAANQTVSGIEVRPPSQWECGPMFGTPASPDGRFAPTAVVADCPAAGSSYEPVSTEVCQTLQELASQSVALSFSMEPSGNFADPLTGEAGKGCILTAMATGMKFSDPASVMSNLVNGFLGWEEQPKYQAGGPTGMATAMTRDMGLMLITVEWMPSPDANCPADQPISACNLTPEQKLYTIQIQAAQK